MKVALLAGWFLPDSVGGTESYVHALAKDLRAAGCEAVVAAPSPDGSSRDYVHDGVPVHRYARTRQTRAIVRGEAPPEGLDAFADWLRRERFDAVHLHSLTTDCGLHHARVAARAGIPLFFTMHIPSFVCVRGTLMRWGRTPCDGQIRRVRCAACYCQSKGMSAPAAFGLQALLPSFGPGTSRLSTFLGMKRTIETKKIGLRELASLARNIIVLSDWMRPMLERNGVPPGKIVLCRHGLPPAAAGARPVRKPGEPLRVGFLGRIDPLKGVDVLVRAFRDLPKEPAARLDVYGGATDANRGYLETLRRLAGGDARIQFRGPASSEARVRAFSEMDVLAVPSVCFETGPLVVLEAFAAGVPVIGSDLGGISEWVKHRDSGLLVKAGDPGAWTRALRTLAEDPELLASLRGRVPRVPPSSDAAAAMRALYREAGREKENVR